MSRQSSHIQESPSKGSIKVLQYDKRLVRPTSHVKRDIVKVAVDVKGATKLFEMDQTKRLKDIIKELCKGAPDWNDYSLQVTDTGHYITDDNQHKVKDGAILKLVPSPDKAVVDLLLSLRLKSTPEDRINAYQRLSKACADPTFSDIFVQKKGLILVVDAIEKGQCQGEALAHGLGAVLEILDHDGVAYDGTVLTHGFIKKMSSLVKDSSDNDATILQRALAILEAAVINSQRLYNDISQEVSAANLTVHIQRSNPDIQHNTIALINALFLRNPDEGGRVTGRNKISDPLTQKQFRTVILNHIIRTSKDISPEMAHQLYVLQVLTFNLLEERVLSKLNPNNDVERGHLLELRSIAFDSSNEVTPPISSKGSQSASQLNPPDFKRLGFENFNNPILEFDKTPPGVFALDCMRYFSRNQQDNYVRMVLENSARGDKHECPFGKSSIYLVKMICEILKIGERPTETGEEYYAMFFTHDHAIEEFYCICIQLLNKTWKEMSAIKEDFDKVLSVVHDQIVLALKTKPTGLEIFKQKLHNYNEILKIREQEMRDKEQFDSKARPVLELQQELRPEILDLVREQRFNVLKAGTVFNKISNNKKFRHVCCRLSPNQKYFHYGDVDNTGAIPPIEEMKGELEIADCKDVIFGKNCPHIKNSKVHKVTVDLAFSICYDPDNFLNFVAPDKETLMYWADGLNALLGRPMQSDKSKSDVDMLLRMEMKLQLLELENIHIPDHPPPIPPLPSNYNFAYNF